jgi:hypothetical protein
MVDKVKAAATPRNLRFSLRALLLAVTAFAIGFPIWYRWPYEEMHRESVSGAAATIERITTWQRQWGGGRMKHGPERFTKNGKAVATIMYRRGLRHGPYQSTDESGQFADDLKEGIWIHPDRTATWRRGKLDGPYEIRLRDGRKSALHFAAGRLTEFNGKPAASRLFDLLETNTLDSTTAAELIKFTSINVVEVPIKDVVVLVSDLHNLQCVLDVRRVPDVNLPVTENVAGVDLLSALTLLTAPNELGCDYRYGCLWITTADDAKDWNDPTGVADVEPTKGGAIARAWNEPSVAQVVNQPLATVLATIAQPLAIEIDCAQIAPTADKPDAFSVLANASGPFRHVLGLLLYNAHCRCELDGDRLVILPPEE